MRAPTGSKIFCVAPGRVYVVQNNPKGSNYGIHVRVQHADGYVTTYGHLQEAFVSVGDDVQAGSVLGLADNTGNSFGSHLHLTLKKRGAQMANWPPEIIDPTPFLTSLLGWQMPTGPYLKGWVANLSISIVDDLAQALSGGVTLRLGPDKNLHVPEGTIMIVNGPAQSGFAPVLVSTAAIGQYVPAPGKPGAPPAPHEATVNGWAWADYLKIDNNLGMVRTSFGINLRERATKTSANIGVVRRGSTVVITGDEEAGYVPVTVRRADFIGPVNAPENTPTPAPTNGSTLQKLPEGIYLGWVPTQFLKITGLRGETPHRPISLQSAPGSSGRYIGTVRNNTGLTIAGQEEANYTPVLVNRTGFLRVATTLPVVELPDPLTEEEMASVSDGALRPMQNSTPGWVLSGEIVVTGFEATAGPSGLNLREAPQRDAKIIGFVPPLKKLFVTDNPLGEFTPVRVDEAALQPPVTTVGHGEAPGPEAPLLGQARIGLHASADPHMAEAEFAEFANLRPGIIKILSFHAANDIARLAKAHPDATWIVRAFLSMENRRLAPRQFFTDTFPDVQRALDQLKGKNVVVELHNEPNLVSEGMGSSWKDGQAFNDWFQELLGIYRQALPTTRFIFPGLSPGNSVSGVKQDHITFIEACRKAIEAADGLGVHLYWSNVYPLQRSLDVLDDTMSRFRNRPVWVTEASNNKSGTSDAQKAREYLLFWRELQKRPHVQGVTYFVAAASDARYKDETWVGKGIGRRLGMR